ncbi:MAG: ATP-binding protein [Clostridia bacterium]|nr:ATP-binding protein [Clostridia bacterium]
MKIRSAAFNQALKNELNDRRLRIARLKKERENEVYSRIPELKKLDEETKKAAYDMGRELMGAEDANALGAAASAAIEERLAQHARILRAHGYPENYLDPEYICPDCRDTGRIGDELCRCVTQLAVNTVFADSGIDREKRFERFDLELQKDPRHRAAMKKILDHAIAYADAFPENEKPDLLYFGLPGVGKTYLLNCIGARVLERGYSVLKINSYELIQLTLDNLRAEPDARPDFTLPDLLIIDDLGTEPMIPNITIETLLSILCRRQDSGKPTLFATNLSLTSSDPHEQTMQDFYGERFSSRLMAPRIVKLQAVLTENVRLSM